MKFRNIRNLFAVTCLCFATTSFAQNSEFSNRIRAAMSSDVRTAGEAARDANRKPMETLAFFQLAENMKVLELVPGGGWYTKLLAPALKDDGQLYVAVGLRRVKENLLTRADFSHVKLIDGIKTHRPEGSRFSTIDPFSFGEMGFDAVLTFRNLHNFTAAGRENLNKATYEALKPGGLYGVVDHTRRHMEPTNGENRRRVDPVLVIKEIQFVGFELVDFSGLHYKPNDELELEVGQESVTGRTDRFTLLFRKPED